MKKTEKVYLELTLKQAEELEHVLFFAEDEGPLGEGWKSDKLDALCKDVHSQLEAIRNQYSTSTSSE